MLKVIIIFDKTKLIVFITIQMYSQILMSSKGLSWPGLYGSWIYCAISAYQVSGFLWVLRFPLPLKLIATI
jgi:hypothetical protein